VQRLGQISGILVTAKAIDAQRTGLPVGKRQGCLDNQLIADVT